MSAVEEKSHIIDQVQTDGPRVTVLVYVDEYNENFPDCLKSLHNQILDDMEVICIAQGENSEVIELLKNYTKNDHRFRVVPCKVNDFGLVMNQGIKQAKGEYIGFLNPYEFVDPEMFIELFALVKKYDADIAKSNYFEIINKQEMMHESILPDETGRIVNPAEYTRIFYEAPIVGAGIYRKDYLLKEKITFLPGSDYYCKDVGFHFKALAAGGKIILTDKPYLHCRKKPNAKIENIFRMNEEYAEVEKYLKSRKIWNTYGYIFEAVKFGNFSWYMTILPKEQREKFLLRMRAEFQDAKLQKMLQKRYFPKKYWKALKAILKYPPSVYLTMFKSYAHKKK